MAEEKENPAAERHLRHEGNFKILFERLDTKVSWTVFWSILSLTTIVLVGVIGFGFREMSAVADVNSAQEAKLSRQDAVIGNMTQQLQNINDKLDRLIEEKK